MPEERQDRLGFNNLHMCLTRVVSHVFECDYCHQIGSIDRLRSTQCTYDYEPCRYCGSEELSPECKEDCPGMLSLLQAGELVEFEDDE